MPIYEYVCESCGHEFEVLSSMSDRDAGVRCASCGAALVTRKMSVFASRQPTSPTKSLGAGGCGRCGDPSGPCSND